jgi:hypothetical protein
MSTTVEETWTTVVVFPYVSFTSIDGKEFLLARERVIHAETYASDGEFDHSKTFVNFVSPNHKSKGALHAVVDMPVEVFRDTVIRPAYEGNRDTTS